jgi:hypothetical protein
MDDYSVWQRRNTCVDDSEPFVKMYIGKTCLDYYGACSNPRALLARHSSAQDFGLSQSLHVLLTPLPVTPPGLE